MEMNHIDLMAFLSFALLGGLGHCVGMCGGIVLSYSAHIKENRLLAHTLYGLGKSCSYVFLGIMAASLGSVFMLSSTTHAILWFLLGVAMLILGSSLLLQNAWLSRLEKLSVFLPIQRFFKYALLKGTWQGIFLLGVANGFLPCGLVYIALLKALGSESVMLGGVMMAIFSIATLLPLMCVGILASYLTAWRGVLLRVAGIAVIAFGCLYFQEAFTLLTTQDSGMNHHHGHH